jgi:hypothetical protein
LNNQPPSLSIEGLVSITSTFYFSTLIVHSSPSICGVGLFAADPAQLLPDRQSNRIRINHVALE